MSYRAVSPSNVLNFLDLMNYHKPKQILGNSLNFFILINS